MGDNPLGKLNLKKYWCYWLKTAVLSFQEVAATRPAAAMYLAGKFIRFFFFLWFILVLRNEIQKVAGYTLDQIIVFFLVFNLFDLLGQMLFRGIYWFRNEVISGNFDFNLVKPISPLFQVLTKHTDFLDFPLLVVILVYLGRYLFEAQPLGLFLFAVSGIGALLLVTAFHIIIAALGVLTTEVDHAIMVYRDLSTLARFPIDIYSQSIRFIFTFAIPIALIFTVPAKALLLLLHPGWVVLGCFISVVFYWLSLRLWRRALTQYSSASS